MVATHTYSTEAQLLQNTPKEFPNAALAAGRLKRSRNLITLATQDVASTIKLVPIPTSSSFAFGMLTASVSLGSATIAIGDSTTAGRFRADAVHTATVATLFGISTAVDDDLNTSPIEPLLTVSTAALPASGTLIVDMYYSQA